jgi:hypothetical protein
MSVWKQVLAAPGGDEEKQDFYVHFEALVPRVSTVACDDFEAPPPASVASEGADPIITSANSGYRTLRPIRQTWAALTTKYFTSGNWAKNL